MTADLHALAGKLTEAEWDGLVNGACALSRLNDEYSSDCICGASACEDLQQLGYARPRERWPNGVVRTPLGLALRAHLSESPKNG